MELRPICFAIRTISKGQADLILTLAAVISASISEDDIHRAASLRSDSRVSQSVACADMHR